MTRRTNKAALLFGIAAFMTTLTLAQTPNSDEAATARFSTQLEFNGQEPYEVNGAKGTRYKLNVTNRASHPDFLWRPTQQHAPCGKNQNASRTWVEVFGSPGDQRLAGFCGFRSSEDLGHLWFGVPAGEKGPPCVYIVMTDRQTGKKYESNRVCSRSFTISTATLKGNAKPAAGKSRGLEGTQGWIEIGSTQLNEDKPATQLGKTGGSQLSSNERGNTKAQVEESVSFNFAKLTISRSKGNHVEILISTPDSKEFLSNPVSTLRRQGVAVPQAAEAHWDAFTVALRRLGASSLAKANASRRSPKGTEFFHYKFDKIEVLGTIAGDGNGNGTIATGTRNVSARFLADPLATLRAERVEMPAADELAWRQMADALKELQGFYSRIKPMRNAERGPR